MDRDALWRGAYVHQCMCSKHNTGLYIVPIHGCSSALSCFAVDCKHSRDGY